MAGTLCLQDQGFLLTLGLQHLSLLLGGSGQNGGLLGTLGLLDLRLTFGLGGQNRGALGALGGDLLLHGGQDSRRRLDRLELDAGHADAPRARRLVKNAAQLLVDGLARGLRLLEVEGTDQVTQRGRGQLLDRLQEVRDFVGRAFRIGDLEVDHRVDRDHRLVGRDDGLRREVRDLLTKVDARGDAVHEGNQQVEATLQNRLVATKALNNVRLRLRDNPHRTHQRNDNENNEREDHDHRDVADDLTGTHNVFPFLRL